MRPGQDVWDPQGTRFPPALRAKGCFAPLGSPSSFIGRSASESARRASRIPGRVLARAAEVDRPRAAHAEREAGVRHARRPHVGGQAPLLLADVAQAQVLSRLAARGARVAHRRGRRVERLDLRLGRLGGIEEAEQLLVGRPRAHGGHATPRRMKVRHA